MAIRLQELHPMLVHLPITLVPLAIGADVVGCLTGRRAARSFARRTIGLAATGAVAAAVTGLIAGEEVNVEGESRAMLMTHRNLNVAATAVTCCLAVWRLQHSKPNAAYLATGAAGIGILGYTAYLGGRLVYGHGVGVVPAHGVYREDAPRLRAGQLGTFFITAATDLVHGLQHMAQELAKGQIVPTLVAAFHRRSAAARAPVRSESSR